MTSSRLLCRRASGGGGPFDHQSDRQAISAAAGCGGARPTGNHEKAADNARREQVESGAPSITTDLDGWRQPYFGGAGAGSSPASNVEVAEVVGPHREVRPERSGLVGAYAYPDPGVKVLAQVEHATKPRAWPARSPSRTKQDEALIAVAQARLAQTGQHEPGRQGGGSSRPRWRPARSSIGTQVVGIS